MVTVGLLQCWKAFLIASTFKLILKCECMSSSKKLIICSVDSGLSLLKAAYMRIHCASSSCILQHANLCRSDDVVGVLTGTSAGIFLV